MTAVRITVHGRVQGVFYRWRAREAAERLGVAGSAVNADDGTVRIAAEGAEDSVNAFIEWCREGSEHARVERLEIETAEPQGFKGFTTG